MTAAFATGSYIYLDHLAPLCELWDVPLIVIEKEQLELGRRFYPMIDIRYIPMSELTLEYLANHFNTIITCGKFWAMELKPALKLVMEKKMRFIFSPHGMSDKEEILNQPTEQDVQLVYGPLMKERLGGIEVGNVRLPFYHKYKEHFDAFAKPFFQSNKQTILYAPTWKTHMIRSSFFSESGKIIESLSDKYNLLIKLHPRLEEVDPVSFHRIIGKYEKQATFIEDFPLVYPILEKTDVYLGDFSSIGYDFLYYDRPMYFLQEGGRLNQCGELYTGLISDQKNLSPTRKVLYEKAFGHEKAPLGKAGLEKITQQKLLR